jgi:hypothetical protein
LIVIITDISIPAFGTGNIHQKRDLRFSLSLFSWEIFLGPYFQGQNGWFKTKQEGKFRAITFLFGYLAWSDPNSEFTADGNSALRPSDDIIFDSRQDLV